MGAHSGWQRLQILLPPLPEQRAIAAETRYLAQLREVKRGLAQALLAGRVRLPTDSAPLAGAVGAPGLSLAHERSPEAPR